MEVTAMKKLLLTSGTALLLLAACGQSHEHDGQHTKKESHEHKETQAHKETHKHHEDKKHHEEKAHQKFKKKDNQQAEKSQGHKDKQAQSEQADAPSQLSEDQRLALAFYAKTNQKHILTKNEVLTGFYTANAPAGKMNYIINHLILKQELNVSNAPEGMKFYSLYPGVEDGASIIGVNDSKIFIGGTQTTVVDYNDLLKNGEEVNIKDLYDKYKNHRAWPELTEKVKQAKQEPDTDSVAALPTTMAHMRSQIHQIIQDFEGHPIDNQYLWDNVSFDDPKHPDVWTMKYRNQDGELLGSYSPAKDGQIVKYDQNGNEIARKHVKVKAEMNE